MSVNDDNRLGVIQGPLHRIRGCGLGFFDAEISDPRRRSVPDLEMVDGDQAVRDRYPSAPLRAAEAPDHRSAPETRYRIR